MIRAAHLHAWLLAIVSVAGASLIDAAQAIPGDEPSPSTQDRPAIDEQIGAWHDALRRSSDLRLRIVASTETSWSDESDPTKGTVTREIIPAADLVEQARGATDPLLLDLMVKRCGTNSQPGAVCDAVDFARRWTEADTQNQLAWLTLAWALEKTGDLDTARATFVRAAQASSWHEHGVDLARVVAGTASAAASPRLRHLVLAEALRQQGTWGTSSGALLTLGAHCEEDGVVRAACAQIVATIFRDTESLMGLTLAAPFAKRARVDPPIVAGYQQESDAMRWSMQLVFAPANRIIDIGMADEEMLRRENALLQATIEKGERRLCRETLLDRRVTTSDAAARYIATLSQWQLEQRADPVSMH